MFSYEIMKDPMNINEAGFSWCLLAMHIKFQITIFPQQIKIIRSGLLHLLPCKMACPAFTELKGKAMCKECLSG